MFVLKIDVILVLVVRLLGYELTIYLVVREITVMLDPFLIKIKIIIIIIVNINKKKKKHDNNNHKKNLLYSVQRDYFYCS